MKYHQILAILGCALFTVNIAHSAILTVDNKPGAVAMYNDVVVAYNAAQEGDTISIAASPIGYSYLTVNKRLNFEGSGYSIPQNAIEGVVAHMPVISGLEIAKNALVGDGSGTKVSGVYISGLGGNATGVMVDRCHVGNSALSVTGWTITRCLVTTASIASPGNGCVIRNTIFARGLNLVGIGSTVSHCLIQSELRSDQPSNSVSSSIIISSYNLSSFAAAFKGSITHSLAVGDSILPEGRRSFLPTGGGNLNDFNLADVFASVTGTEDGRWQLKAGSPAIGTGFNGADMGAFGGPSPYILSGIPPQPRITRLVVPAAATDATGFQFEVDAKAF